MDIDYENWIHSLQHKSLCHKLTLDVKVHRLADSTTNTIRHVAPERSLVVAAHTEYSDSGAAISELNSVTGRNLRAAVQPDERERGSRGGAGQTDGAELQQDCVVGSHRHIRDWCCWYK